MTATNLLVAVLVLALILRRQLRPKAIRSDRPFGLMIVLGAVGVAETVDYVRTHHVSTLAWIVLAVSLMIGIGFGALRGALVHVWQQDGVLYRQGNAITVVLWLVAIAIHIGMDLVTGGGKSAGQLGTTSLVLYLALSLAAQRYVTLRRRDLRPDEAFLQPDRPSRVTALDSSAGRTQIRNEWRDRRR